MTPPAHAIASSPLQSLRQAGVQPRSALKTRPKPKQFSAPSRAPETEASTVFDLLYDEYLPFRLYADYMLGISIVDLAKQFTLSEHWIAERIEAVRLCFGKQVRVKLFKAQAQGINTIVKTAN